MNELVRWDPFKTIAPFEDSVFDLMPALLRPVARRAFQGPRMDITDTGDTYRLAVELAGVKKEAIQVSVYENSVTISAELPEERETGSEEQNWLLRERSFGKFSRTITLPEGVDENASEARYTDGVLYLTLQKKRASQTKRITVN